MRRERFFAMPQPEAIALFHDASMVHLAGVGPEGEPILRALNAVVVDGALCFHASPVGEKVELVGRPVVITVEEIVASVPSYFVDAERACPATTLYRSAQAHGVLEAVTALDAKARVLAALMAKYQPEGGHVPIAPEHPRFVELYEKQLAALLVARLPLTRVDGKSKLAQNRSPEERARLCDELWRRGLPGDPRAIELIRAANRDLPTPRFLQFTPRPAPSPTTPPNSNAGSNSRATPAQASNGGSNSRATPAQASNGGSNRAELCCALDARDVPAAVALLAGQYWNVGHPPERIAAALLGSTAWVGARDGEGRLVACARAISDGHKRAWIYDVVVAPAWRGRGLGEAVMRLLLSHPRLRDVAVVELGTRDAMELYRKLGFVTRDEAPPKPYRTTDMLRLQR